MLPSKPITVGAVANDILEATMLAGYMAGSDTALAKYTKRALRPLSFKPNGLFHVEEEKEGEKGILVQDGKVTFSCKYPDGTKADYELIHGVFSERTGFQAAAYKKTIMARDGHTHSSIKLIFPGTAMRHQFQDLNAFDTFWMKRVGSQIHNAKQWLDTEILPRIGGDQDIEISAHCLGTQSALWAKAYLEHEKRRRVPRVALLEPTSAGLVVGDIARDLGAIYGTSAKDEIKDLYRNVYTVFVDPPTIVNPLGYGNLWDTASVGEQCFTVHLPETRLYEELGKAIRRPHIFRKELREKIEEERADRIEKREREKAWRAEISAGTSADTEEPEEDIENGLAAKGFFRTALGTELGQQFFKNHYLLSMTSQILKPENKLTELITEGPVPDATAMLKRRTPYLGSDIEDRLKQLLTAKTVDKGRSLAAIITQFCLKGGRMGVPCVADREVPYSQMWSNSGAFNMDSILEEDYPWPYFRNGAPARLESLLKAVAKVLEILPTGSDTRMRLEETIASIREILTPGCPEPTSFCMPDTISELQARRIMKHLPKLHDALDTVSKHPEPAYVGIGTAALRAYREVEIGLQRGYDIRPSHDIVKYH